MPEILVCFSIDAASPEDYYRRQRNPKEEEKEVEYPDVPIFQSPILYRP
jgi:hypothetical protein